MKKTTTVNIAVVSDGVVGSASFDLSKSFTVKVPVTSVIFVETHPLFELLKGMTRPFYATPRKSESGKIKWIVHKSIDPSKKTITIFHDPAVNVRNLFAVSFFRGPRETGTAEPTDEEFTKVVDYLFREQFAKREIVGMTGKDDDWVLAHCTLKKNNWASTVKNDGLGVESVNMGLARAKLQEIAERNKKLQETVATIQTVEGQGFTDADLNRLSKSFETRSTL